MAGQTSAIFDDHEVREFLDTLKWKGLDIERGSRQLGGIIASTVFKDILAHFDQEQGPDGQWKGWSSIYAEHMATIGKAGNKILQDSGRLRNSFRPGNMRFEGNALGGGIVFFNPAQTSEGFPYAAAHDEGGEKLPQREFMWLSEIAMEEIGEQTLAWLLDE